MNKNKKIKKLVAILSVVSIVGAMVIVLALAYDPSPDAESDSFAESDRMARQILQQASDVDDIQGSLQSFYQNEPLSDLTSYTPTELPPSWGRVNPFIPFNLELRLEGEREEKLEDLQQQQLTQEQDGEDAN